MAMLKLGAREWKPVVTGDLSVPPTSSMGGASTASFVPGQDVDPGETQQMDDEALQNDLVQVTRHGCIFFVERSQAEQLADKTLMVDLSHSNCKSFFKNKIEYLVSD